MFGDSFFYRSSNRPALAEPSLSPRHSSSSEIRLEPLGNNSSTLQVQEAQQFSLLARQENPESKKASEDSQRLKSRLSAFPALETRPVEEFGAQDIEGPEGISEDSSMGRKPRRSPSPGSSRPQTRASGGQNGQPNGDMESFVRRKHASLDSTTSAFQTANLMGREDFTLDNEPPPSPLRSSSDTSFFDLPRQDRRNFLLLIFLYFLQGVPIGLALGSVPIILKKHLSYSQVGIFSLAAYPYSLKLLWSPIVDAVWSPVLGRRKSWILPMQMCSGIGMIYLGSRIKQMMVSAGAEDGSGIWGFTWWWFFLVFLCATQDIAVDGKPMISFEYGLLNC